MHLHHTYLSNAYMPPVLFSGQQREIDCLLAVFVQEGLVREALQS